MQTTEEQKVQQQVGNPWSTGLFDCHENQTNAVMTAFFPCVTFGQIAEVLDGGELSCHLGSFIYLLMMPALCTQWIMGSKYREKLRKKYDLVEAPYTDVISHIFCPCCSLCQEFRELTKRGLDPALGMPVIHRDFSEATECGFWKITVNHRDSGWNGILARQQSDQTLNNPPPNQSMSN